LGTPVLGRIPGLKNFFGSKREVETKTELVILLRPIVVDDDEDWPNIIRPAAERLTALEALAATETTVATNRANAFALIVLEKKLISEQQLKEALDEQRVSGRKLGRVLIDIGAVSEADLHGCLATALNIPYVDLAHMALDPKVVSKLPETHARRHRALVLKEDARGYLVGMADPTDLFAFDELARLLGKPIRLALAKEAALLRTIDLVYRRTEEIVSLAEELDEERLPMSICRLCRPKRPRPTRPSSSSFNRCSRTQCRSAPRTFTSSRTNGVCAFACASTVIFRNKSSTAAAWAKRSSLG
jgi:hypothetical protein